MKYALCQSHGEEADAEGQEHENEGNDDYEPKIEMFP